MNEESGTFVPEYMKGTLQCGRSFNKKSCKNTATHHFLIAKLPNGNCQCVLMCEDHAYHITEYLAVHDAKINCDMPGILWTDTMCQL
jgi:hypothetical protein